jgi:glycerophosphoryl diester phosphodiesterase
MNEVSACNWLTRVPIAHRGLHDPGAHCPENSLPAFERAVQFEFPIELDVRLLKDGRLVVFHDASLKRMTGVDKPIGDLTARDIESLTLVHTRCRIPFLEDVLSLVDGRVPLVIEIKNRGAEVGPLESILRAKLKKYDGEYAVEAFNPSSLKWFRKNAPHIIRGQLSGDFGRDPGTPAYRRAMLRNLLFNTWSRPDFIAYDFHCLPALAVRIACRNRPLIGWTTKSEKEHARAMRTCDNVIFEGYLPRKPA